MDEQAWKTAKAILAERFGKDNILALATVCDGEPRVRYVNGYYRDGAFYIITHALSAKMAQIAAHPQVSICGEWFTAQGVGENLGYIFRPENAALAEELRQAFSAWFDNGHNDYSDTNTCILRIRLTHGLLLCHGMRYSLDFTCQV